MTIYVSQLTSGYMQLGRSLAVILAKPPRLGLRFPSKTEIHMLDAYRSTVEIHSRYGRIKGDYSSQPVKVYGTHSEAA